MKIDALLNKPLPAIPPDIKAALDASAITPTSFSDKNEILKSAALQQEVGYCRFENGDYLVSMTCPMPNITHSMMQWWFWWHPQADIRYKVWFPGAHFGISYAKKDAAYFGQSELPPFQNNIQYPVERISGIRMPLEIDFQAPEEFGFSHQVMEENSIPLIVSGHVGAFKGLFMHTEMAHIFKQTPDGLLLLSRFWIGQTLKNPLIRKAILTDKTARGMAEHCCVEYRNLSEILPKLYNLERNNI